jgi:hypothetical protein
MLAKDNDFFPFVSFLKARGMEDKDGDNDIKNLPLVFKLFFLHHHLRVHSIVSAVFSQPGDHYLNKNNNLENIKSIFFLIHESKQQSGERKVKMCCVCIENAKSSDTF